MNFSLEDAYELIQSALAHSHVLANRYPEDLEAQAIECDLADLDINWSFLMEQENGN